jgi:hypothetical protein
MIRKRTWILAAIATIVVAGACIVPIINRRSALDCVHVWARLDAFPASATKMTVDVTGTMFTRTFVVDFDAPLKDIDAWLATSPGTVGVLPQKTGATRHYTITPGGGAAFAELTIDESTGHVHIRAEWS